MHLKTLAGIVTWWRASNNLWVSSVIKPPTSIVESDFAKKTSVICFLIA